MTGHKQTTDGRDYTTGYTYNLAGGLVDETYPSGRVVENVLDGNGDLSMIQSKKNANAGFWHYADSISYTAAGAVSSLQLGNGHWESTTFNSRLQPTQIALGVLPGQTDLLNLQYTYESQGNHDNNGNILTQAITVPNSAGQTNGFTASQTYTYDELNRLKSATETIGGNQSWKQTFTFDRYGNRRFDFSNGNTTFPDPNCSEPICNPTISTSNNRLTSTGWLYDNAGNTTRDASYSTFTYDGENKQVKVRNSSNVTRGEYWYDGDGKRVKKKAYDSNGILTEETIFVYDATGRSIAEYSALDPSQIESGSTPAVAYLTSDHLGSPRINTNASGAVSSRHDYHPFGEEIISAQRTAHPDYSGDTVRKQFTGYERDNETELDFAQARMFSNQLGRFSVPDPQNVGSDKRLPQSWNAYTYVANNPINAIDPSGLIYLRKGDQIQYVDDGYYNKHKNDDEFQGWEAVPYGTKVTVGPNPTGIFAGFEGVTIRLLRGDRQFEVINPPGVEPVTVYAEHGPDELSPLQQMLNGSEEVLWWGRPVVYAGTAVVCVPAALPGLTAAGGSAASGGLLGLGLTEGAGGLTFTSAAINQGVASVLSNSNNVGHIFHSKHLLEPLLLRYGSQAGVLTHVLNQLNGRIPPNGAINTTIDVGGYVVRVTGQVVNGIPMISNVWIPMGPHP